MPARELNRPHPSASLLLRLGAGAAMALTALLVSPPPVAAQDYVSAVWQKSAADKVIAAHYYPQSAISREVEGQARISVTVDRAGNIVGFEILQQPGDRALNRCIEKMLSHATPLPTPPESLAQAQLTFEVPLSWSLD